MSEAPTADLGIWVVALVVAAALLGFGLVRWLRSRAPGDAGAIRVLSARGLGGRRLVVLVEVEGERLLLGLTDTSVGCLARFGGATRSRVVPITAHRAGG